MDQNELSEMYIYTGFDFWNSAELPKKNVDFIQVQEPLPLGNLSEKHSASSKETLCPVCNASATGIHYGIQTCDACKVFFCRAVRNGKGRNIYSCSLSMTCAISKDKRYKCRHCRFKKCLEVGMKITGSGFHNEPKH